MLHARLWMPSVHILLQIIVKSKNASQFVEVKCIVVAMAQYAMFYSMCSRVCLFSFPFVFIPLRIHFEMLIGTRTISFIDCSERQFSSLLRKWRMFSQAIITGQ